MSRLWQQVKGIDFLGSVKLTPHFPCDAFFKHPFTDTQTVEYLKRALGPADRPRTDRDDIIVIKHHGFHTMLGKVDRHGEPDRACAHDDHGMAAFGGGQACRGNIGEGGVIIGHQSGS